MNEHTKGPWQASEETYPAIRGNITIYSELTTDCIATIPASWVNKQANGRLLAAAPELLNALRSIARMSAPGGRTLDELMRDFTYICDRARSAIDKAEGK